ncbi:MAG: DNA methyltransferase [Dehalococcoidia bacterium]|nr:DNA methyltransferase [Dehalococcoidia bacterium]
MIKYIGSKRTLVPLIVDVVDRLSGTQTVIDLFSGTSRVGHALKRAGYRVLANDHNAYAAALARCYVETDREDVLQDAETLVREFNALRGSPGYFTETFCVRSRFFQPKNGERVDAIREAIAVKGLQPDLESVMLTSLMEAADRVDSTTGVQMAYLKGWAPRASNDLRLRVPEVLPRAVSGRGVAHCLDAFAAADGLDGDIAYVDPPYNQHSYLGNYHIWESLVRWDKPEAYGVACKRVDCRQRQSVFNSRPKFATAFEHLLSSIQADTLLISFNDEGYVSRTQMEAILAKLWGGQSAVATLTNDYKRYVGAQIGIYNPQGEKVGKVSHLRNKEFLYVATRRPDLLRDFDVDRTLVGGQIPLL